MILDRAWQLDPGGLISFTNAVETLKSNKLCWRSGTASLCHWMNSNRSDGQLDINLSSLDWQQSNLENVGTVALSGLVNGEVSLLLKRGKFSATGSLLAPVDIGLQDGESAKVTSNLSFNIDEDLSGTASLQVSEGSGNLLGFKAYLPQVSEPGEGLFELDVFTDNPGLLTALLPSIDQATGSVSLAARLDSQSSTRNPTGQLNVQVSDDASLIISGSGITLRNIQVNAETHDSDLHITASAKSGEGKITNTSTLYHFLSKERSLNGTVTADHFQFFDRPDLAVNASSDVSYRWTANQPPALDGSIVVHRGRVKDLKPPTERRKVSPDVEVINRQEALSPAAQLALNLDILVEDMSLELFGLQTRMSGNLGLKQAKQSPAFARGNLNFLEGSFSRFGQSFAIERGRLVFNGPLDNPLVDVISTRTVSSAAEPVTVSLILAGTADNLTSSLRANPEMTEANALSYLLIGRPLRSASSAEGASLANAAIALGLKKGLPVAEQIQTALGLTELSVSSSGMDSTAVIAGKKLNEKLHVEYNYDIFARVGGILFNYQLTPNLSIETRSGEASSMRLLYRFE